MTGKPEQKNSPAATLDAPLDPWYYFRILWGKRWLIVFTTLIGLVFGVLSLRQSTPAFQAVATIKYEMRAQQVVDLGERSSILYQRDELATAVQMVKSPSVAAAVLKALGEEKKAAEGGEAAAAGEEAPKAKSEPSLLARIQRSYNDVLKKARGMMITSKPLNLDPAVMAQEDAVRGLLNTLQVVHRPNTKLIEVRFISTDQRRAARVANEVCEQFIRMLEGDRQQAMTIARTFLNEQIAEAKIALNKAERNAFEYTGEADTQVLAERLKINSETMVSLNREVEQMRIEIALLESEDKASSDPAARAVLMQNDEFYASLRRRRAELAIELTNLSAENEAANPAVLKVERQIAGVSEEMRKMEDLASTTAAGKLVVARAKLAALETRLSEQKKSVNEMEAQMIDYRVLMREIESSQAIFANLLDSYKRLEVLAESSPSNVTIIARANVPRVPAFPSVSQVLSLYLMLGAGAGLGLALLLHFSDRTVKNPNLVEERLGLPTLGLVPALAKRSLVKAGRKNTLLNPATHDARTESFNYLRTSIQYSTPEKPPRVLLVTSCLPQEGKSTVGANLGIFCASRGGKTLLIDADLKRPTAHRTFELSRQPGLTDVLTGQAALADCIKPTSTANFFVLPAGLATPSPINLLDSEAMGTLLKQLSESYESVIVDSAPCYNMADSLVLASRVDGVCLVVRTGSTPTDVLAKSVDKLRSVGAQILGIAYNNPSATKLEGYGADYEYQYKQRPASSEELPVRS
jgi:capsular exopolysaccharide synthesis family protein